MCTDGTGNIQDLIPFCSYLKNFNLVTCLIVSASFLQSIRGVALDVRNGKLNLFCAHLSETPSDLRELLSTWYISTTTVSVNQIFFAIKTPPW